MTSGGCFMILSNYEEIDSNQLLVSRNSSRHTSPTALDRKILKRYSKMHMLLSAKIRLSSHQKRQKTGKQSLSSTKRFVSHTSSARLRSSLRSKLSRRAGMLWRTQTMMTSRLMRTFHMNSRCTLRLLSFSSV
jgi:hypothetical protein